MHNGDDLHHIQEVASKRETEDSPKQIDLNIINEYNQKKAQFM